MNVVVRVQREPTENGATIGALYVNDEFVCWTLEDTLREVPGVSVAAWKKPGETAVPAGRYVLRFEWSPKFKRNLWELKGVEGFSETKFHAGNAPKDTEGCILVGLDRGSAQLTRSQLALVAFHDAMRRACEAADPTREVVVDVNNPPGLHFAPGAARTQLA